MSMSYPALAHAVAELRGTADELDRGPAPLHTSFGSFLGGGWTGQAAESFVGGWDDWSDGVSAVLDALGSLTDLVVQHGRELQAEDLGASLSVDRLHSRLGGAGGGY